MKITISRAIFLPLLEKATSSIEPKSMTPVLSNVLLSASEKGMMVVGTDLDTEMACYADNTGVEEAGDITVSAKKLLDICKSLPVDSVIELKTEDNALLLKSGRSRFELATLSADDFPVLDSLQFDSSFKIPENILYSSIQSTSFSMAVQDVRYYLNGMLLTIEGETIEFAATDGHRLAWCKTNNEDNSPEVSIIIPRKSVLELYKLLDAKNKAEIEVQVSSNHIRIKKGDYQFTSKLIDGKYPDYKAAMPGTSLHTVTLDRLLLKDSLSRVAILSNDKFRGVLLKFTEGLLSIEAGNTEKEGAKESLDVAFSGNSFEVGFNVTYLLDAINHVEGDVVMLELNDVNASTVLRSPDSSDVINVVMPVKI